MSLAAQRLDELGARGWPALESLRSGPWLLRASKGVTRRGNSALPLGTDVTALLDGLDEVRAFYAERGLPVALQVSDPALAAGLASLDWVAEPGAEVLTGSVPEQTGSAPTGRSTAHREQVTLRLDADQTWLGCWDAVDGRGGAAELHVVQRCLALIELSSAYAAVLRDGAVVAVGRAALDGDQLGVFSMAVLPEHRRTGLGRVVLEALCTWGSDGGANRVHLQVFGANAHAQALYRSAGLTRHHTYSYYVPGP